MSKYIYSWDSKIKKEFLEEYYINKKLTSKEVAKLIGCTDVTIRNYLVKFNILIRSKKEVLSGNKRISKWTKIITREYLEEEYIKKEKNTSEIERELGCGSGVVRSYLIKFKIPLRSKKIILQKFFKNTKGNHYIDGRTPLYNLIRNSSKYFEWRDKIFERDNYTCQECKNRSCKDNIVVLNVHHIKLFCVLLEEFLQCYNQFSPIEDKETLVRLAISYQPFWDLNNGKTLCKKCHDITKKETIKKLKKYN